MHKTSSAICLVALLLLSRPIAAQSIKIKGSDTLLPLSQRWAQLYAKKDASVQLIVSGGGSAVGIAALLKGETDVAEASRPVSNGEKDQFKAARKTLFELTVASDAVEILVSPSNPVSTLTLDQIRGIFSGSISNWKDVGGLDAPIHLYGRDASSGTYAFLKEHALKGQSYAPGIKEFSSNAPMIAAVANDPNGICYAGLAAGKSAKHLRIKSDQNSAPVEPNAQSVNSGKYPLSRSLHWYLASRPSGKIKDLCDWILSRDAQAAAETAGFVPISAENLSAERARL